MNEHPCQICDGRGYELEVARNLGCEQLLRGPDCENCNGTGLSPPAMACYTFERDRAIAIAEAQVNVDNAQKEHLWEMFVQARKTRDKLMADGLPPEIANMRALLGFDLVVDGML